MRPIRPYRPASSVRPRSRAAATLGLIVLAAALPGCTMLGGDEPAVRAGGGDRAAALGVWREFAGCLRGHGYPDFPDPVVRDDGSAEFQGDSMQVAKADHAETLRQCRRILARLPATARAAASGRGAGDPPTREQVDQLRRFARCVREHGIPEWPDPDAGGSFPLRSELRDEGKSPRFRRALQACDDLNPDPERGIVIGGPAGPKP